MEVEVEKLLGEVVSCLLETSSGTIAQPQRKELKLRAIVT